MKLCIKVIKYLLTKHISSGNRLLILLYYTSVILHFIIMKIDSHCGINQVARYFIRHTQYIHKMYSYII